jgi:hypothetical protein
MHDSENHTTGILNSAPTHNIDQNTLSKAHRARRGPSRQLTSRSATFLHQISSDACNADPEILERRPEPAMLLKAALEYSPSTMFASYSMHQTMRQAIRRALEEDSTPRTPNPTCMPIVQSALYCCALACLKSTSSSATCACLMASSMPPICAWLPCIYPKLRRSCSTSGAISASGASIIEVSIGATVFRQTSSGPSVSFSVSSESCNRGWS